MILIVEDNRNLRNAIVKILKQEKYQTHDISYGDEAYDFIIGNYKRLDMIILDVMLPGKDGFSICEEIRSKKIDIPVLFLTAKDLIKDKIKGFNLGGDDYLVKPFDYDELIARVRSLLKRPKQIESEVFYMEPGISFLKGSRKVYKNGYEVQLTAKEFCILELFIKNKNKIISNSQIFDSCFDFAKENFSNCVEVHIKNLRKKLFYDKNSIKTLRGQGYCLEA